jgi:hypothetical protein
MKLSLDIKIPLEIQEGGKTKEKLEVFLREFTKQEKKDMEELMLKFKKLFKKLNKLSNKETSLDKKIELNEKLEKYEKALKLTDEKEKISEEIEQISEDIEELGGEDFEEEMAKKRFDLLISGNDKEKLREYCEIKGYSFIMQLLDKQKGEFEKK